MTSTSVLAALQQAAGAAAAELSALAAADPLPARAGGDARATVAPRLDRATGGGAIADGGTAAFTVLAAPATPQRIKAAVGPVSVAAVLRTALGPPTAASACRNSGSDDGCRSSSVAVAVEEDEEWLIVHSIAGAKLLP